MMIIIENIPKLHHVYIAHNTHVHRKHLVKYFLFHVPSFFLLKYHSVVIMHMYTNVVGSSWLRFSHVAVEISIKV